MELKRFTSIQEFYERTAPFLLEREAEHNLILGLCARFMRHPERIEHPFYIASVEEDDHIVAAALKTHVSLILSHAEVEGAIPLIAADLYRRHEELPEVIGPVLCSRALAEEWQRLSGQPYTLSMAQRIYQLEEVKPVTGVAGQLRRAEQGDRQLLLQWLAEFTKEALDETDTSRLPQLVDRFLNAETEGLYFWQDSEGNPVSMASATRPTPNGICIGAVYTPVELRGRGYASACVASLSQKLLDEGRKYCFLHTDLANPTSNHIYQAIGYEPVCDADVYKFGE